MTYPNKPEQALHGTLLPMDCFAQTPQAQTPAQGAETSRGQSLLMAAAVFGAGVAFAPAAVAQASGEQTLGEITVTAPQQQEGYQTPVAADNKRLTAPLLDTPKTVTVIPEEVIRDRGATSLSDVLRTTPGITLGAGEGGTPMGDRPFVRGYEASTDIFVDGVRDFGRTSHETFNLESVEVIKGPSSTFTGRGGTGGSINLVTKSPKRERFAEVGATVGNAKQWRTTADVNLPFAETAAARLNLLKAGGEVPGRGGVTVDRLGIAPSVAFGLGTPTRATLSYSFIQNDDMPDQGIPFSNEANNRATPPRVNRENFYGRLNADFRENTMRNTTIELEHDVSEALKLRNITRHVTSRNHYLMSRPTFDNCSPTSGEPCVSEGPDVQFRRNDRMRWRETRSLLNQTDVYGEVRTGGIKHNYVAGFEFGRENVYSRSMSGGPGRSHDSLWNPNPHGHYDFEISYGDRTKDGNIKSRSLYVLDTMELSDRFSVNAGLRRENFKVANNTTSRSDSFWNYQLGLVYKPARNGSIYVSYGTSSNPAGENLGQGGGADGVAGAAQIRDLKPEKSRSWELGTKWDVMDQRLSLSAAVFETAKTDARSTDPLTGDVTLSGKNRVRGLELAATGAITPQWHLWSGVTLLDPKIQQYTSGNTVYDGNQLKFVAKRSATLWTTYDVMPNFTLGGGASYQGQRYADDANTLILPSHVRYDAMAQYRLNKQLSLQFNINNISNARMYDASHVGIFAYMGPGRSYTLNATYRFD